MEPHPFLDAPRPRAMAHRGWHTGALAGLENTMAAFRRAVAEGYDYVETDARVTADGVVLAHHDATLVRTCGVARSIAGSTAAQLRRVRVGGRQPVPSLAEVLDALPDTRFNIDLKTDEVTVPLLRVLDELDAWHRVCLASFSERRLARARHLAGPWLLTSLGPASVAALRARSVLPVGLPRGGLPVGGVVQVPAGVRGMRLVDRRLIAEAHRGGREVHVWTVDDPERMRALLRLGVDGIITDAPDVLHRVLTDVARSAR